MRKSILALIVVAAMAAVVGCNGGTSVPVAPDKPLPDTNKMTPEEIQKLHSEGSAGGSDRQRTDQPAGQPGGAPGRPGAGRGDTPADRGG